MPPSKKTAFSFLPALERAFKKKDSSKHLEPPQSSLLHHIFSPSPNHKKIKREENLLFLKRLLKNPKSLGAITPSSHSLGKLMSQQLDMHATGYFVEIGAGTGSLSLSLLRAGIAPNRLFVVEVDPVLAEFLRHKLPKDVTILNGDACNLKALLPSHVMGHVESVISGIPMMNLNKTIQKALIQSSFDAMKPCGSFLQFTYGPLSPLPSKKLGLTQTRIGHVLRNIPPASVWMYKKQHSESYKTASCG